MRYIDDWKEHVLSQSFRRVNGLFWRYFFSDLYQYFGILILNCFNRVQVPQVANLYL